MKQKNVSYYEALFLTGFIVIKFVLSYVLVNNIYELHRDEFLHLDQANHLAAGFTSVPPLTSIFSLLIKFLGNSEFWVRFFPALFGALTILFTWFIVSILKGNLFSKCLVAVAFLCSAYLRLNTLYQPNSFDVLAWTAMFYFLLKYFENNNPKYLYFFAIWFALGFLNKYNIIFLILGLLPALLLTPRREIFKKKHLYFSSLVAFILILPNVVWQITNGFPVIAHMRELAETQLVHLNRIDFFKEQLLFFINDIFILIAAFLSFAVHKPFRKYLWVILSFIFTLIIFSYFNAKAYYALGLYPVLFAFGCVYLSNVITKRYTLQASLLVFIIGSFIYVIPLAMPFYSPQQIIANHKRFERVGLLRWGDGKDHQLPQDYADMLGWKELTFIVDSAYRTFPDKKSVIVLCDNWGQAGAINYYSTFKNIHAVSFSADYINWFNLDHPLKHKIRVREFYALDKAEKDRLDYGSMTKIGSIQNSFSLEYGTTVYLLKDAKIDVNKQLREIIKEEKR